jgi:hypothetical protein
MDRGIIVILPVDWPTCDDDRHWENRRNPWIAWRSTIWRDSIWSACAFAGPPAKARWLRSNRWFCLHDDEWGDGQWEKTMATG